MLVDAIIIDYLKNHSEFVQTCAQWSYQTWGHYTTHKTLDDYIQSRKEYLNDQKLPLTLVAFDKGIPVGMCSLSADRGVMPELTPWLASLYVLPPFRNKGIGSALESAICAKALQMGFEKIYCFTSDVQVVPWYLKHNWKIRCTKEFRDHQVTIMEKKFTLLMSC